MKLTGTEQIVSIIYSRSIWLSVALLPGVSTRNATIYRDTYCIDTHLGHIDISNIVIYQCIVIKCIL